MSAPVVVGTNLNSDANATSYVTATYPFIVGRLYVFFYHVSAATAGDIASGALTGAVSGTWNGLGVTANFRTVATPQNRMQGKAWFATSTVTEALTLDFSASNQIGCRGVMVEWDAATSTPLVQADSGVGDAGTAVGSALTLATFASANNLCLMATGKSTGSVITAAGGLTELVGLSGAAPAHSIWVGYQVGENLTPSATWGVAADWGAIGCEIAASSGGFGLNGVRTGIGRFHRPAASLGGD